MLYAPVVTSSAFARGVGSGVRFPFRSVAISGREGQPGQRLAAPYACASALRAAGCAAAGGGTLLGAGRAGALWGARR